MAEPQRKYTSNIDPEIRPNLRVINGGGESTSDRGDLSSVSTDRIRDTQDSERNFGVINGGGESTSDRGDLSSVRDDEVGFKSNVTGNQSTQSKRISVKGILGNKKWLASLGVTGVAGLAIAAFLTLIPLKLEMFISNITQSASAVPGYAVEQRTEYIITRALATRLLMKANGGMDTESGKIAFCGGSSIACSLWLTYSSDYFEKKLGITFEADGRGRAKLGGKAQSWDIIRATESDGRNVDRVVERITSNSEMKAFLKTEVKSNNNKNIVTRYIGRKILMKKYGVRNFNGPKKLEETRNSYTNAKTRLKANVIANTIGKISPRVATYLTCLQGGATCAQVLRKSFTANGVDLSTEDPGEEPEGATTEEKERYSNQKAKYEAAKAANETIRSAETGESPTGEDNAAVKKFISSKVVKIAGGSVAGVGVLDLIFGAIGSIDNGALEEVWYDIAGQSYVGFAYEDVIIMNEKMKAGDMDMATLQAATELFDGAEESPLQQYENGSSTTGTVTRKCATSDGEAMKTLSPGELVCPDNKVVRKYGESFKNESWWGALSTAAAGWNGSVGKIFDFAGEALGELMSRVPGFDKVAEVLGKALGPAMEWIIEKLFDPPSLGYDDAGKALGASNYDALSGAIRIAQNDTMLEGVSEDGTAGGAGGRLLSSQEISAITNDYTKEEQDMIAQSSSGPAFLNPLVKGSLTQQLALMAPTSTKTLTGLPSHLLGAIIPKTTSVNAATASNINPFGLPISGYTDSDGVFDADPKTYTEDYCTTSAKAREDSFKHNEEVGISVYTKSDPCALEKMVVGAELISNGVTDDEYSLKDPLASLGGSNTGAGADLSVMTYNIRRDALTDSSNRNNLVVNAIKAEQPDLIGFQEMDQVQVTAISDALPQYAKTSDKLGDTRRIFWNKEKFKKVRDGTWSSAKTEGSNSMPWIELEANGTSFYVFNLHTQPSTGEANTKLRAADGEKLINDVIPSVTNNDGKAVIVTGDMNSGYPGHRGSRSTEFYSAFTKNKTFELAIDLAAKKTGDRCETAHSFGSQDCGKNNARHIDHIYVSKNVNPTVSSWKNIADDTTKDASDHNPVIANISIPGVTAAESELSSPASVTTEGYAFPVALSGLQGGIKPDQTQSLHWGGYNSFDLMSKDDTAVYAITDGEIEKVNRSYTFQGGSGKPCESITFKSKDGYYYWYGHIINSTTKTGSIKAGEKIAEVAGKSYGALCHGGSPHLHIDRAKGRGDVGGTTRTDPTFIPFLSKIYEEAGGK